MIPARSLRAPPEDEVARGLAAECRVQLQEHWRRTVDELKITDVIGLIRQDDDGVFVAAVSRAELLAANPILGEHFPCVLHPAHDAHPRMPSGTAMWLMIGAIGQDVQVMRVTQLRLVSGGAA